MNTTIPLTASSTPDVLKGRRLQSVRLLGERRLSLHFHDGLIAELNFHDWLADNRASMSDPLLDEAFFAQVFLDRGVLSWPNGFDLHPDTVRAWAEQGFCD